MTDEDVANDSDSPASVEADVVVENEMNEVVTNKYTDDIIKEKKKKGYPPTTELLHPPSVSACEQIRRNR